MTESRRVVLDPDAATTVAVLRAPAAIVSAAFLAGLVAAAAGPGPIRPPTGRDAAGYAVVALVMMPFLLPSRWYRAGRTIMRTWIVVAAVIASVRAVYIGVALYARRPALESLMVMALYLAEVGTLWLAVFAVQRGPVARADPFGPASAHERAGQ